MKFLNEIMQGLITIDIEKALTILDACKRLGEPAVVVGPAVLAHRGTHVNEADWETRVCITLELSGIRIHMEERCSFGENRPGATWTPWKQAELKDTLDMVPVTWKELEPLVMGAAKMLGVVDAK